MNVPVERIGDDWPCHQGHVARYLWAANRIELGEAINDIACGTGYGAEIIGDPCDYHGYDRPGVYNHRFPGVFHGCDLDDPLWRPRFCDVTICFETLEHVEDPAALAAKIEATTRRAVFVSVPTVPTVHMNPFHRHDFDVDDIPLMFPGLTIVERWEQTAESSHVWHLECLSP